MSNKYCSPNNSSNTITCLSNKSLLKIAEILNYKYRVNIQVPKYPLNENERKILWENIEKELFNINSFGCQDDYCVLDDEKISSNKHIYNSFRPPKPFKWNINKQTWLSTLDIRVVLNQYRAKHTDFEFIGPVPLDFDKQLFFDFCVSNELCKINLKKMIKRNKTKLGIVFNLDTHDQSGSHWVALFADFNLGNIYYFDSYGLKPPQEIINLMKKIEIQGNQLINEGLLKINKKNAFAYKNGTSNRELCYLDNSNINKETFNSFYNCNRFQFKNSECGMYSIHFIVQFLEGKKYNEIVNNIINDDAMNQMRDFYYRPSKNTQ